MRLERGGIVLVVAASFLGGALLAQQERDHRVHQYHFGSISIPPASADEPVAEDMSLDRAVAYVEAGAKAWVNDRGCVACHTAG